MMAHLFTLKKETCNARFELKVNNYRYAGYPIRVSRRMHESNSTVPQSDSGSSTSTMPRPDVFNIVFVLKV